MGNEPDNQDKTLVLEIVRAACLKQAALLHRRTMTLQTKIDIVRNNIINNAQIYSSQLAGRYYLYIF